MAGILRAASAKSRGGCFKAIELLQTQQTLHNYAIEVIISLLVFNTEKSGIQLLSFHCHALNLFYLKNVSFKRFCGEEDEWRLYISERVIIQKVRTWL
jgi:hypothetical protein